MKKLKFIPIRKLEEFIYFLKNGGDLHIDSEISFAKSEISQKVVIDKNGESTPFSVATFRFKKNAGLYFVAELSDAIYVKLRSVMDSLSSCGIGGERSTGYGKFEYDVSETNDFATKKAELYIALSSIIPTIDDLDLINNKYCSYILSEKGGYVDSLKYAENSLKKRSVAIFEAGSTFNSKLKGSLLDVSQNGMHPVYKYGYSFYLGVDL